MISFASLWQLILALPTLLKYLGQLDEMIKKGKLDAWIQDVEGAFHELEKSDTPEARLAAARRINDLSVVLRR